MEGLNTQKACAISQHSQRENKRNIHRENKGNITVFRKAMHLVSWYRSNIMETEHKGYVMLIYISRLK